MHVFRLEKGDLKIGFGSGNRLILANVLCLFLKHLTLLALTISVILCVIGLFCAGKQALAFAVDLSSDFNLANDKPFVKLGLLLNLLHQVLDRTIFNLCLKGRLRQCIVRVRLHALLFIEPRRVKGNRRIC